MTMACTFLLDLDEKRSMKGSRRYFFAASVRIGFRSMLFPTPQFAGAGTFC